LNRVDEIIIFNPLTPKDIEQIVEIQLSVLRKRLENKDIKIELNDDVKNTWFKKVLVRNLERGN